FLRRAPVRDQGPGRKPPGPDRARGHPRRDAADPSRSRLHRGVPELLEPAQCRKQAANQAIVQTVPYTYTTLSLISRAALEMRTSIDDGNSGIDTAEPGQWHLLPLSADPNYRPDGISGPGIYVSGEI